MQTLRFLSLCIFSASVIPAFATRQDSQNTYFVKISSSASLETVANRLFPASLMAYVAEPILKTSEGNWFKVYSEQKLDFNDIKNGVAENASLGLLALEPSQRLEADVFNDISSYQSFSQNPPLRTKPPTRTTGSDPLQSKQWGAEKIAASQAWDLSTSSLSQVVVADIDTGIDYNHDDLFENLWRNRKEIPNDGIDNDNNGYVDDVIGWDFVENDALPFDSNVHGTHTAGVIAASFKNNIGVAGYAPNVKLMPLRFLGEEGGTTEGAVLAIQYAVKNGAQIISASWGGNEYSQMLADAIQFAGENNVTFVAAAGNKWSNNDSYPHYPASFPLDNIISVAASDETDSVPEFSNWGTNTVHLTAPGVNIISTIPTQKYQFLDGTSMATPHATAGAAIIKQLAPMLSPRQIRDCLMQTVDQNPKIRYLVKSGGRLNIGRAAAFAKSSACQLKK